LSQKRTCAVQKLMSAKCQKRTHAPQQTASLFAALNKDAVKAFFYLVA
jgi:hypothetical protein